MASAQATRQQQLTFLHACSFQALRTRLPLPWPAPAEVPPSPKTHYRSHYGYLGSADLATHSPLWGDQQGFELLLRLVDFAPLRPVLAQLLGWTSAKGWIPFDPVSMFLLHGWQLTQQWTRAATLRNLALPRYADIRARLGFVEGVYPTEGGCRYFLTALGQHSPDAGHAVQLAAYGDAAAVDIAQQRLNALLAQAAALLHAHGFLSSTAWSQALVCPDGMLHPAASHMRCTAISPLPAPARRGSSSSVKAAIAPRTCVPTAAGTRPVATPTRATSGTAPPTHAPTIPTGPRPLPPPRTAMASMGTRVWPWCSPIQSTARTSPSLVTSARLPSARPIAPVPCSSPSLERTPRCTSRPSPGTPPTLPIVPYT